jgi:short-subunit dehydrogenase
MANETTIPARAVRRNSAVGRFRSRYGPWAVITGASDGIGKALAGQVAARGINVILVARNEPKLRAIADQLTGALAIQTRVIAADVSDSNAVARLEDQTRDIDVGLVILAAGFGTADAFADAPLEPELEMIGVNITAVARLAHTFARRLVDRGSGGMILFGSILGWQGVPGQASYGATKAYVQSLAEGLHHELAPRGVDVLSVAPGPVQSGFGARAAMNMRFATTPDVVARATLEALGSRTTVVPGFRGRFLTAALSMLPRGLRIRVLGRVIRSMRTPTPT